MVKYFFIFTAIGFLIAKLIKSERNGLFVAIAISIIWGLSSQPIWGLVTLGELLLGFLLGRLIFKDQTENIEEKNDLSKTP
jgi:hypothetical protein